MGNYSSNQQQQSDTKRSSSSSSFTMVADGVGCSASDLQMASINDQPTTSNHEFEMKHMDLISKKTSNEMDDHDMKMLMHTFDSFINHVLQEKLTKIKSESEQNESQTSQFHHHHNHHHSSTLPAKLSPLNYKEPSTKTLFDNLAQMLSTHLDDYLDVCKRSGIVTAPTYKSCPENYHLNMKNLCNNKELMIMDGPNGAYGETMQVNHLKYNNNLSHPHMIVDQSNNGQSINNRRLSLTNNLMLSNKNCFHHVPQTQNQTSPMIANDNKLNNLLQTDNIRINLPEILDQHDEITILRLLIKLLSGKVRKLNDENRYLLHQITALNDINTELASLIKHKFEK